MHPVGTPCCGARRISSVLTHLRLSPTAANRSPPLFRHRRRSGRSPLAVRYTYDNTGALATVTDSASGIKTTYYYDLTDRLIQYTETGTGHSHAVGYVYDRENKLTSLTEKINGTAFTTSYTYDDDNRVSSITDRGITESYTYDAYGRVTQKVTKNGSTTILTETYTYRTVSGKPTGQIATHRSVSSGRTVTYTYNYDANGNITSVSDGTYTTTYVYDSANQLTRENNQADGVTRTFTYDRAGNITAWTEYAYTTGTLGAATATHGYTYGNSNWRDQLTAWNGNTITSDTIGNMLSDGTRTYTWRNGRELATVTKGGVTWTNTYNADSIRTKRTNGTNTYSYIYNGGSLSQMTVDGTVMNFAYDASGTPMAVTYGGATYYYATNIQGDVVAILNSSGAAVVTYTYDAWGNILTTTGTLASTLGIHNPLRYRSYVYDQETGLYYLQSRYYNPEMGRFLSADAFASTGQGILGNNMYAYCQNNPVLFVDPSGCIIILAPDATEEQIEQYLRAIAYLKQSAVGKELIERLDSSKVKFFIHFIDDGNMSYDSISNVIYFDISSGLILKDGSSVQSAALGLAHEMGHAAQDLDGFVFYKKDIDKLEASNLEMYETPIARELGEPIRTHYSDSRGTMLMQNSTHYRVANPRPWWHYVLFWELLTPYATDYNVGN